MPIIPSALQAQRHNIPQSLASYQLSKQPQQQYVDSNIQSRYDEAKKKLEGASYDNYSDLYSSLDSDLKQYFTSPSELKKTAEYQSYAQQKSAYESAQSEADAWNTAVQYYNVGLSPQRTMGKAGEYLREFYKRETYANEQMRMANQNVQQISGGVVNVGGQIEKSALTKEQSDALHSQAEGIRSKDTYFGHIQSDIEKARGAVKSQFFPSTPQATYNLNTGIASRYNPLEYSQPIKDSSTFQKQAKTDTYTYDASSGFYSTVSPTGRQGTAYIRPPSISEQKQLDLVKQKERNFWGGLSNAANRLTAEGSNSSVWQRISAFGESAKEGLQDLGAKISESAAPVFKERRLEEENLSTEGQQIDLMIQDFQIRYQNASQMQEGSPERQQYEAELQGINQMVEQHNQRLANYTAKIEQAQEEPVANVFGLQLFKGGAEFARGAVKGAVEFPFTIGGMVTGLVTDPVSELIGFGRGIKQLPSQIEQYPASTLGYLTGQVVAGKVIGGFIKKGLQPTYNTEVVGVSKAVEGGATTDILFKTTESKFGGLFKKDYFGKATGISKTGELEGVQFAKTLTGGIYSPIVYDIITGRQIATKPTKFGSAGITLSKEAEVVFTNPIDDLFRAGYTKEGITGFASIDLGKIATKKGSSYYAGTGGGITAGSITEIFGKTGLVEGGNVLKGGRGTYWGFIKQYVEKPTVETGFTSFLGGGGKSSQTFLNQLYGNTVSSAVSSIAKETAAKPSIVTGGIIGLSIIPKTNLVESQYPTYVGGTKVKEETPFNFGFGITGGAVNEYTIEEPVYRKGITPTVSISDVLGYRQKYQPSLMEVSVSKEKPKQSPFTTLINPTAMQERQNFVQTQPSIQKEKQLELLRTKQVQEQAQPTPPTPINNFGFGLDLFTGKEQPGKERAFFGFIKVGRDWKKATPLSTFGGAVDLASRKVDFGTSRQFKVLPATKEIKGKRQFVEVESSKLYQGDDYFTQNQFKFRNFQQRKGVRSKLPSGAIEKSKFAMDYETPKFKQLSQQAKREAKVSNFSFGNQDYGGQSYHLGFQAGILKTSKKSGGFRL